MATINPPHHDVSLVDEDVVFLLLRDEQHLLEEEHVPQALGVPHPEGALRSQLAVRRQVLQLGTTGGG